MWLALLDTSKLQILQTLLLLWLLQERLLLLMLRQLRQFPLLPCLSSQSAGERHCPSSETHLASVL